MKKLLNSILLPTFFFFSLINFLMANEIKYSLRRFNTNFYNKSYSRTIKYQIEKKNKFENELKSVKMKLPTKNGKYEGIYKVGKPYTVLGKTYYPREDENYKEIGMASWYGKDFHNKKTSNGEIYNMNDYTAAHRTLPMPSIARVINLENGKSIKVRINDRGPFAKNRIIDVSKKVAKALDFHEKGTTKVKVEYLKSDTDRLLKKYGLK